MNIKLKAFLLALVYVALPFVFVYVLISYPLAILAVAVSFIVYLVYHAVLASLQGKEIRGPR